MAADNWVARGKGFEIGQPELVAFLDRLKAEAAAQGRTLTPQQVDVLRVQARDQLILRRLCEVRAEEADRVLARANAKRFIGSLKAQHGVDAFPRLLKSAGYGSEADFERDKISEAIVTAVIDREVKTAIRIPSQDVRGYYESNPDRWKTPASVRYLHLQAPVPAGADIAAVTAARQRMEEWRRDWEAGTDFSALLRKVAAAEASAGSGGEETAVTGQLPSTLETAVFQTAPGKVSAVVAAEGAFHVVRVLERTPSRQLPLDQVEEDIQALLLQRETALRLPDWIRRIRQEAGVEVGAGK